MSEKIIQFSNFSFQYYAQSKPTLKNINLTINKGEKILIVGPSGSGKSTLGHCLNGLIPFAYKGEIQGSLKVNGIETKDADIFTLSKSTGTVLQDSDGQFVGLTVGEDIAFALENDNVEQSEMIERVKSIAKLVSMEELLKNNPYECSGGQKQRVALAGVMVDDVEILLFDEPLANLDPATGKTAIELIDDIHQRGKTIVIIEHRLEDVLHRHIDRIIVVNNGEILMDDTPDNVLSSPILIEQGIREPLYITACKYAGVQITADLLPANSETFKVDKVKEKLQQWFNANNQPQQQTTGKPLLEIKQCTFSYDGERTILDNVDITIHEGEMVAIVGKNGAGKSTLSKLIVGFDKQDSGDILLNNENLASYSIKERAEHVGIVLQNPNQMISKTLIFDEIALGLKIRGYSEKDIDERVSKVMEICGLLPFKNWPISALSYGQKKRVTIASILVLNPKILILDEPTAGQDYRHYSEIMEFLQSLNKAGQTIIMITHDMHLMLEYTPRAIVLSDKIKQADTKAYEVLCNQELIEKANLKETSLFDLAVKAEIDNPLQFVESFIHYEKGIRSHED